MQDRLDRGLDVLAPTVRGQDDREGVVGELGGLDSRTSRPLRRLARARTTGRTLERVAVRVTIVRGRRLTRDVAVDDVVAQPRGVALGRHAEPARARRTHRDLRAGRCPERALAAELSLSAVRRDHDDATGPAGAATRQPERRGLCPLETDTGL